MSSRWTPSRWNPSRSYVRRARVLYSRTSREILLSPSASKPYRRTTRMASVPYPWDQNDGSPINSRGASNAPSARGRRAKALCPSPVKHGKRRFGAPAVIVPDRQRDRERAARTIPVDDGRVDVERCGPSLALRWIRAHAVVPECLPDARPVSKLPGRGEIVAPGIVKARAECDPTPDEERSEVGQGPGPRGRVPDVEVVEHP